MRTITVAGLAIPDDSLCWFTGRYRALSNFYEDAPFFAPNPYTQELEYWQSSERYFQAEKMWGPEGQQNRETIRLAKTNKEAKRYGRWIFKARPDWPERAPEVMVQALDYKFDQNEGAALELEGTGTRYLVEGNYHHDNLWGVCFCPNCKGDGENLLGIALMHKRRKRRLAAPPPGKLDYPELLYHWLRYSPHELEGIYGVELAVIRSWLDRYLAVQGF